MSTAPQDSLFDVTITAQAQPAATSLLEEALNSCHQALAASALRLTGNHSDARDLLQDAVERALRSRMSLPTVVDWCRWLLVTMRHRHVDNFRHLKTVRRAISQLKEEGTTWCDEAAFLGCSQLPRWRRVDSSVLDEAIARLDPGARQAIELWLAGRSLLEISIDLGTRPATAGTRLFRARAKLRLLLGALEAEVSPEWNRPANSQMPRRGGKATGPNPRAHIKGRITPGASGEAGAAMSGGCDDAWRAVR